MVKKNEKENIPGGDLYIYQFSPPVISQRELFSVAKRLRLKADMRSGSVIESEGRIVYAEGSSVLTFYKASGGFKYRDHMRWQSDDQESNLDIGDEEAIKIAEKFIAASKIISLKDARLLKVVRLISATREIKSEVTEQRVIGVEVAFQRVISNVAVDGPGGKLIVSIGQDKQVNGCDLTWRKIQKRYVPVQKLRNEQQSIKEAVKYLKVADSTFTVPEVRFGFFEEGPKVSQKYLQPAYIVFVIVGSQDNRFRRKKIYVVPAASNSTGRLTPVRRKISQQVSR